MILKTFLFNVLTPILLTALTTLIPNLFSDSYEEQNYSSIINKMINRFKERKKVSILVFVLTVLVTSLFALEDYQKDNLEDFVEEDMNIEDLSKYLYDDNYFVNDTNTDIKMSSDLFYRYGLDIKPEITAEIRFEKEKYILYISLRKDNDVHLNYLSFDEAIDYYNDKYNYDITKVYSKIGDNQYTHRIVDIEERDFEILYIIELNDQYNSLSLNQEFTLLVNLGLLKKENKVNQEMILTFNYPKTDLVFSGEKYSYRTTDELLNENEFPPIENGYYELIQDISYSIQPIDLIAEEMGYNLFFLGDTTIIIYEELFGKDYLRIIVQNDYNNPIAFIDGTSENAIYNNTMLDKKYARMKFVSNYNENILESEITNIIIHDGSVEYWVRLNENIDIRTRQINHEFDVGSMFYLLEDEKDLNGHQTYSFRFPNTENVSAYKESNEVSSAVTNLLPDWESDRTITRGEFAYIVSLLLGQEDVARSYPFESLYMGSKDSEYYAHISFMEATGLFVKYYESQNHSVEYPNSYIDFYECYSSLLQLLSIKPNFNSMQSQVMFQGIDLGEHNHDYTDYVCYKDIKVIITKLLEVKPEGENETLGNLLAIPDYFSEDIID